MATIRSLPHPELAHDLVTQLERALLSDELAGAAAEQQLKAGFPIYYRERGTPQGHAVKEFPDGRRELLRIEDDGEHFVRTL